jgi:hypothetical protein
MSDTSNSNRFRASAIKLAADEGLTAFEPTYNELLLDLDDGKEINGTAYQSMRRNGYEVVSCLVTRSKSGNGTHVYLRLAAPITWSERIALQAILGSDPVKEIISLMRLRENWEYYSMCFETAEEAKRVEAWRKEEAMLDDFPF